MNTNTIHIIWLGPRPVYDKYLPSIRKYCPKGFKIKIWRDDEIVSLCSGCEYFDRNYAKGNWAFCSDYARFKILYEHGGIYIDTDVEFLKPIDDLIEKGSFMAIERASKRVTSGLIIYASQPHMYVFERIIRFFNEEGKKWIYLADGEVLASLLENEYGYIKEDKDQILHHSSDPDIYIYKGGTFDGDWNSPDPSSYAIHWYTHFWVDVRNIPEFQDGGVINKPNVN